MRYRPFYLVFIPMIKVTNLYKSYNNTQVLKNINLSIKKGKIIAITGPSGAGKSTLLNLLGTLDIPDKGEIFIDNVNISVLNLNQLAEFRNKNIGFVFQNYNLLPEFSAIENICMPALAAKSVNKKYLFSKAKELIDIVGLSNRVDHKPSQLSGGEQQRVSIARALINNPSLILADEPTGNLDTQNAEIVYNLFYRLCVKLNFTFIITTHNTKLAQKADSIINMQDGIIIS